MSHNTKLTECETSAISRILIQSHSWRSNVVTKALYMDYKSKWRTCYLGILQDLSAPSVPARRVAVDKCGIQISTAQTWMSMAHLCIGDAIPASHPSG